MVEHHCQCMRDSAKDRMSWCRHLTVIGEDPEFATEPARQCACMMHNYRSKIANPDWTMIASVFKTEYCAGCQDRRPKSG